MQFESISVFFWLEQLQIVWCFEHNILELCLEKPNMWLFSWNLWSQLKYLSLWNIGNKTAFNRQQWNFTEVFSASDVNLLYVQKSNKENVGWEHYILCPPLNLKMSAFSEGCANKVPVVLIWHPSCHQSQLSEHTRAKAVTRLSNTAATQYPSYCFRKYSSSEQQPWAVCLLF